MQVRVENLYYLLSYAWRLFEEEDLANIAAPDARDAQHLLARVLINATRALMRRGLDRGYQEHSDELRAPRGKINIGRTASRASMTRGVLACEFDESTPDVLHNRLLKTVLRRLGALDALDNGLRLNAVVLAREMALVADIGLCTQDFQRVQLTGNLRRYRLAINVCRLLFHCLLPSTGLGGWQFKSFAGDEQKMGALFEHFVREFLTREQTAFTDVRPTRMRWVSEGETHGLLPELRTDITLRGTGQTVIVETKCYRDPLVRGPYGSSALRGKDVNQLAAYLANFNAREGQAATGLLLYAVEKPTIPAMTFRLLGHHVHVRELNLNEPWRAIDASLRELVRDVSSREIASSAQPISLMNR